jgi:ATP-dependent RNA helicase DDX31/DBP7
MDHADRKVNYSGFAKASNCVLICTDVASRGLDFKGVSWIVQYDLSSEIKEYVNRVGRTARMAAEGTALAFIMPEEIKYVKHLKKKYGFELFGKNRFKLGKVFESELREKSVALGG